MLLHLCILVLLCPPDVLAAQKHVGSVSEPLLQRSIITDAAPEGIPASTRGTLVIRELPPRLASLGDAVLDQRFSTAFQTPAAVAQRLVYRPLDTANAPAGDEDDTLAPSPLLAQRSLHFRADAPLGTTPRGPGAAGSRPGGARRGRARLFSSVNFVALDQVAQGAMAAAAIPHVLHQNFMGGRAALEREVLKPHSYFRRDWWRSCQTHHPGWTHVFWDAASARRLLRERYPWFLPTWDNYTTPVLRSDSLRTFILHAFGGVYLDLDTECFRPMDDSLAGYQAVFMAESDELVNNAQMGSAPGHPIWAPYQRAMAANAAAGIFGPVRSTGPMPLTAALKSLVGDSEPTKLRREYRHLASATVTRVYNFGEWFTPCAWNNASCGVEFERHHRTRMRRQRVLVGKHHYATSWRPDSDNTVALRRMNAGIQGIVDFVADPLQFAEYPCLDLLAFDATSGAALDATLSTLSAAAAVAAGPSGASAAPPPYRVCGEQLVRSVKNSSCLVLSIRQGGGAADIAAAGAAGLAGGAPATPRSYGLENSLAQFGCSVTLYSDRPVAGGLQSTGDMGEAGGRGGKQPVVEPAAAGTSAASAAAAAAAASPSLDGQLQGAVRVELAALGIADDPFAELPVLALQTVLQHTEQNRVTVAYIDCGACAWHVVNQLYVQGLDVLCLADALILDLGPLTLAYKHHAHALYQHLFQELGFLGLQSVPLGHHHSAGSGDALAGNVRVDGTGGANGTLGGQVLMGARRLTLVNTGHSCRQRAMLLLQRRHEHRAAAGGHMHGAHA